MERRVLAAAALLVPLLAGTVHAAPAAAKPDAVRSAAVKPKYNNKAPKGFQRWNAPGVTNVNKYIYPRKEYFGVFTPEEDKVAGAKRFAKITGRKPNIVKGFYNWGDGFDTAWAKGLWKYGAIPQLELELWPQGRDLTVATIAAGEQDDYIRELALAIRAAKMPVVFSFAHEFNAEWYPWGDCSRPENDTPDKETACDYFNTPQDWTAAWRRMHDIFRTVGATNAIWLWQPNEIGSRPEIALRPYWPGAKYVDWVGIVGYDRGRHTRKTFAKIFLPTVKNVRTFTKKPIIIPEVGTSPGKTRTSFIKDFLASVNKYPNIIGFLWFNADKRPAEADGDFRLEAQKSSVTAFKQGLKYGHFGFPVK
ncbi:hypothetical protein GCM10027589_44590 [Actinocorallia lasiicapitis]